MSEHKLGTVRSIEIANEHIVDHNHKIHKAIEANPELKDKLSKHLREKLEITTTRSLTPYALKTHPLERKGKY